MDEPERAATAPPPEWVAALPPPPFVDPTSYPDRPRLVGLVPVEAGARFRAGSLLLREGERTGRGLGHVSSVADSPTLGWIALGFVAGGLEEWEGRTIVAASPVDEQYVPVRVVSQHFLDPEGERMHG